MLEIVTRMIGLRRAEGLSRDEHARRAGLGRNTLISWERDGVPNVANLEAALGVLGYGLKIVPVDPPPAPLRSGPLVFTVAGVLRDNGPRWWSALEVSALLKDRATRRQVASALAQLRRQQRVRFNGTAYRSVLEKERTL